MDAEKVDEQAIVSHLRQKWQNRPCPMCGEGGWNVQDSAFELRPFYRGGLVAGGPVIPVVPIVCTNCGNTVLVNAIIAGVVPRDGPPKKEAEEETS